MQPSLSKTLFSGYRCKVLGLLLLNPEKQFHLREIARRTNSHAGTLLKELQKLTDAGILARSDQTHQTLYQADQHCPIYEELASILRKTSGLANVLAEALEPLNNQIEVAFVFGSLAQNKEHSASDIDLLVIGAVEFSELAKALYPIQDLLSREINPKIYTREEWSAALKKPNGFLREILNKPKIFIKGDENDIGQSDRN